MGPKLVTPNVLPPLLLSSSPPLRLPLPSGVSQVDDNNEECSLHDYLGCVLGSPRWRGGYGEEDLLSDDRVLPASGATHGPTGGSKRNVPCPRVQEAVWRL